MPLPFWARFNGELKRQGGPGFLLLGELLDGDPAIVARTWTGGGFTSLFDFPLAFAMADVFCRGQSPAKLAAVLTNDRRYPDAGRLVTLLDNHDLPRIASVCGGDTGKVADALTFLFAARGVPSLIWGTEVGMEGEQEPANRATMRFVEHPLRGVVAEGLTRRSESPALESGASVVLAVEEGRVALGRASADQLAVVLVGKGPWSPVLPRAWAEAVTASGRTCGLPTAGAKDPEPARAGAAPGAELRDAPPSPRPSVSEATPGGSAPLAGNGVLRPASKSPRASSERVAICLGPVAPGAFFAVARAAELQQRAGARTRTVTLVAAPGSPPGLRVVGSGPELGDWRPERALALPVTVALPVGGAFELKLVGHGVGGTVTWSAGDNTVLFLDPQGEDEGAQVSLPWRQ